MTFARIKNDVHFLTVVVGNIFNDKMRKVMIKVKVPYRIYKYVGIDIYEVQHNAGNVIRKVHGMEQPVLL